MKRFNEPTIWLVTEAFLALCGEKRIPYSEANENQNPRLSMGILYFVKRFFKNLSDFHKFLTIDCIVDRLFEYEDEELFLFS